MPVAGNVTQQIERMQQALELAPEGDPIELLQKTLPRIRFERNYLSCSISADAEASARQILERADFLYAKLRHLESVRNEQENSLQSLRSPRVFGRSKYEQRVRDFNCELERHRVEIQQLRDEISKAEAEFGEAREVVEQADADRERREEQYANDEALFEHVRALETDRLVELATRMPQRIINAPWNEAKDWLRGLFRTNPVESLYPHFGWQYAQPLAFKLCELIGDWKQDSETITLEGKPRELRDMFEELLMRFVYENRVGVDTAAFQLVRAMILHYAVLFSPTLVAMKQGLGNLSTMDQKDAGVRKTVIEVFERDDPRFVRSLRDCRPAIEQCLQAALREGDEDALNMARRIEETCRSRFAPFWEVL